MKYRTFTIFFAFAILNCLPGHAQQPTQAATPAPAFRLVSSNNPSSYGDPVDFTAIFPEGTAGTVTFKADATILAKRPVSHGQANFRTSALKLGTHAITAVYSDGEEKQLTSVELTQTIHEADPNLVLFCSPNWSIYGEQIECEATLPYDASGTVTFLDEVNAVGKSEPVEGSAKFTMPRLSAGSHLLTASYGGDSNYRRSHGRQTQTILQADSKMKVYCSPAPAYYDETVTCVAEGPPYATGAVTFTDGGVVVANAALVDGIATWSTFGLGIGYHHIGVAYRGDVNYRESKSWTMLNVMDVDVAPY